MKVHPGETFTLPAVVVGADLGTTIGTVHENSRSTVVLESTSQYGQWINSTICSNLSFTIFYRNKHEVMYLTVMDESVVSVRNDFSGKDEDHDVWIYQHDGYVTQTLLNTPPLLNITLLPCPPGFILLGDPPGCDCYPID